MNAAANVMATTATLFTLRKRNTKATNSMYKGSALAIVLFISGLFTTAMCQQPPATVLTKKYRTVTDTVDPVEDKLVQLAIDGPAYKSSEAQNKIYEYQLKKAKNSWLNLLSITANYNDRTFAKNSVPGAYVYPMYLFGVNIPLGIIFSKNVEIKAAKEAIELSKNNQEQLARSIRADVLAKYRQYKTYSQLILIQSQVIDDEQAAFLQAENKFRTGKVTIDIYNAASKAYNAEIARKLNLQLEQDIIRLDIEKMIGVSLISVINRH